MKFLFQDVIEACVHSGYEAVRAYRKMTGILQGPPYDQLETHYRASYQDVAEKVFAGTATATNAHDQVFVSAVQTMLSAAEHDPDADEDTDT